MAQTSCQLASGYPRAGRNIPGLPHHTLDRQAPTTITARDFDHFMRVPPNGTLQRGNSQAARLHRRSRSRAGPPRNCFREAGTMLLFPGRGLENYDASIIRPGCGGRHVCWTDESSRLPAAPAPLLHTDGASSIALFYEQHSPSSRDRVHNTEYSASFRASSLCSSIQ